MKKLLLITIFGLLLVSYALADYKIGDKTLDDTAYTTSKTNLITKFDNRKSNLPSYADFQEWSDTLNIELAKCGSWQLTNVTAENLIDKLNDQLEAGC